MDTTTTKTALSGKQRSMAFLGSGKLAALAKGHQFHHVTNDPRSQVEAAAHVRHNPTQTLKQLLAGRGEKQVTAVHGEHLIELMLHIELLFNARTPPMSTPMATVR
mmetsp:Transcript_15490/g.31420  ORF Transcript_15490/g.31420 Transcript_15490/m.31420 type:complete len:106 (-) Transcript_15490:138-455(-)